jgi:hypothetical protein
MENSLYDVEQNPKPTAPPAPPQPPLYPVINRQERYPENSYSCNSQQFRLVEIQKMRTDLEEKIKSKERKCKKYKKQTRGAEYISAVLSTFSVLSGSSAAVSTLPVITFPLAIPMGVVSAVTGASSAIILVFSRNRRKKQSALTDALILEKSVYNSIMSYISREIDDKLISHDEYEHIRKLYEQSEGNRDQSIDDINQMAQQIANILKAQKK